MTAFDSTETWNVIAQFFIVAVAVLVGNILRRKLSLIRRSLVPSALLGGLLILCFKLMPWFNGIVDKGFMEILTYHMLALGFISMSLRQPASELQGQTSGSAMTVLRTGTLTVGTYLLQAILGLAVTIPLFLLFGESFYAGGLLLPMGFGQGPGQALNFGTIYTGVAAEQGIGFSGIDFGLSIAAIGFLAGSVVGVWYMNRLRRRGRLFPVGTENGSATDDFMQLQKRLNLYESDSELPDSESVDKMTLILCIVLAVYAAVYGIMSFIGGLDLGTFGEKTLKPLVYGFNFFWGILLGTAVRVFMQWLMKRGYMTRQYTNNYLLNRISGVFFDVMIVAGTSAISFESLKAFLLPLLLVTVIGTAGTFLYIRWISCHIYKGYENQGFFSMFGMLTGTASNGMILLREIDPQFATPAANNLVLQTIPAMALGFPLLLLLGYAPHSMRATLTSLVILIVAFTVITFFLTRRKNNEKPS
ncbi:MAG: hypothetical protein MJY79_07155 [Bacteroidaceae bacterium]|nr:hypothetical protein [Bacteroidaceae bacterium]